MVENQELQKLLEQIDRSARKQAKYARWQCFLTAAAAVCCAGLVLTVYSLMPQIQELTGQLEIVLTNLENITQQLANADLEGIVHNVDALATASQSAVEQAVGKLNSINFVTLNRAISDLAAVVKPLADFFKTFQ